MRHEASTAAWVFVLVFGAGFYAGAWFGNITAPSYHDALRVEHRLREVFCEQVIRNKLMTTCEVSK